MPIPLPLLLSSLALAAGGCPADPAAADHALNAAISAGDVEAARRHYADDFLLTSSSGRRKDRAAMLADIGSPELSFEVNATREVEVRTLGETAVLTAILHQRGRFKGAGFDATLRVTDTWVRVDGCWVLLAGHASPVATP